MTNLILNSFEFTANRADRTFTGRLLPFGEGGATNLGRIVASKQAVRVPRDPNALTGNIEHSTALAARVSHATQVAYDADGALMIAGKIHDTDEGDALLAEIEAKRRNMLSVEIANPVIRGGQLMGGDLAGYAHVERGAFPSADLVASDMGVMTASDYTQAQLEDLGKAGKAFKNPDGSYSYPVVTRDDLEAAITTAAFTKADANDVRKYIEGRALAMGLTSLIPDTWNADGSLKAAAADPSAPVPAEYGAHQLPVIDGVQFGDGDGDADDGVAQLAIPRGAVVTVDLSNAQPVPYPVDPSAVTQSPAPVQAAAAPAASGIKVQEEPMADATATEAEPLTAAAAKPEFDGNTMEALLKAQFEAQKGTNASLEKLLAAIEVTPVAPFGAQKQAAAVRGSGPGLNEMMAMFAAKTKGILAEADQETLKASYHDPKTLFAAFGYNSGGGSTMAPQWVQELADKVPYTPVVWDLIANGDLTSSQAYGWAFTTDPSGGDYAGGGAVVSSTPAVETPVAFNASRYADAEGIDRINFDFGVEAPFVESYFRRQLNGYYLWRDKKTIANILGSSTGVFGALTGVAATASPTNSEITAQLNQILDGVVNVYEQQGGVANLALLNTADFKSLIKSSTLMGSPFVNITINGEKLTNGQVGTAVTIRPDITSTLTAGEVAVGNGLAGMTGYELPGGPVRVEQIVTSTGTIDFGMFGYAAPARQGAAYWSLVSSVAS